MAPVSRHIRDRSQPPHSSSQSCTAERMTFSRASVTSGDSGRIGMTFSEGGRSPLNADFRQTFSVSMSGTQSDAPPCEVECNTEDRGFRNGQVAASTITFSTGFPRFSHDCAGSA